MEPCTSHPKPKKIKKILHQEHSLFFQKWDFLALILKKILYFHREKLFLYFVKRKILLYFLKRKHFLHFQEWSPALFSRNFKNKRNLPRENFLYFRKRRLRKDFLCFLKRQEIYFVF